jgi:hypothetical protein
MKKGKVAARRKNGINPTTMDRITRSNIPPETAEFSNWPPESGQSGNAEPSRTEG